YKYCIMKRLYFALALISAVTAFAANAVTLPDGPLTYEARYHCGFIKIDAGEAEINVSLDGDNFMATMNGQSVPIGRRVYAISDTICATMSPADGAGLSKETVTYENGWYAKPHTDSDCSVATDFSNPDGYKNINGGGYLDASSETMEAITISADMLALFYYFQQFDYSAMQPGQSFEMTVTLPDGDTQQVAVVYEGEDNFNGYATHKMTFTYSYHGVMTDYPVTAQIDSTTKLPLLFAADIKIGRIELVYKG
ncbi:MAG: DUF3108 domain-containing protein, partial [Muribaculaceae bacterium]|nr:DUF3108 domain-containing protein [Muribaculaceae bacterium]